MFTKIRMKEYVKLAGVLGNTLVRRDARGTSWMLKDGRVVSEVKDGDGWSWWVNQKEST
jgi:hypothetical protein